METPVAKSARFGWDCNGESGATEVPGANADRPGVVLSDLSADGEAEADAAVISVAGFVETHSRSGNKA